MLRKTLRRSRLLLKKEWQLWLFALPAVIFFLVFHYAPMKNASITDPEERRERVRHITALQGMKSQGNNVGRDQMERLFGQMLTELEKAMDVRTNMQPTANDEMVLGMLKEMQNLEPDQRTLENVVGLTAAITGAQLQASEDTQGKLNDVMMSIMADFLKNTTEDGE